MRLSYVVAFVAFGVMGWVGVFRFAAQAEVLRGRVETLSTTLAQFESPCKDGPP